MARNYKTLWVITSDEDRKAFKLTAPLLLRSPGTKITLLSLDETSDDPDFGPGYTDFLDWASSWVKQSCVPEPALEVKVMPPGDDPVALVDDEITKGGYGRLFLGKTWSQHRFEKIVLKGRGRMTAILRPHPHLKRVLVPVDFSQATFLAMAALEKTRLEKEDFQFFMVHVSNGPAGPIERQWKKMTAIIGSGHLPLAILPMKTSVAETLLAEIHAGDYGTVIMGKRGISGIKRLLAGSVSTRVMRSLGDRSLILID